MKWTLVRHGATEWNAQHRYQGWTDVPLTAEGRSQALRVRAALTPTERDREEWDRTSVWTSDLVRARATAEHIFGSDRARPDPRLRELHFGEIEGLTYFEAKERFGARFEAWLADPDCGDPLGIEPFHRLVARVREVFEEISSEGRSSAIVTHAGPIRVILSLIRPALSWESVRSSIPPGGAVHIESEHLDPFRYPDALRVEFLAAPEGAASPASHGVR